jgi:hypothetical protein
MIDDIKPPQPRVKPTDQAKITEPVIATAEVKVAPEPAQIDDAASSKIQMPEPAEFAGPGASVANDVDDRSESPFKTPEAVANTSSQDPEPPKKMTAHDEPQRPWYKPAWPLTKKQQIVYGALAVVVAIGLGAGWTLTHHKRAVVAVAPKKSIQKKVTPAPVVYSTLSGLPISDANLNKKPVTGVMIENSVDARPQSGLGQAGVVFEAVAEGGVTRFLALFQDTTPTDVGPIRSARPYYVQWAMGFDAAYAHVGGSPDALSNISAWGTKDMNQFSNGSYYHRVSSRAAPHNVYTGINTLNDLESKKGFSSTYTGFVRKKEAASKTPNATSIGFSLSGPTYDPHYDYDATTNSYKRSEAGKPHIDAGTNTQISPKVVIAIVVPLSRGALDSSGAYYSNYTVTGTGTAYVFQDGIVTQGTWSKPDTKSALSFTAADGTHLALNPGQTWISAVTGAGAVSYK